MNLALSDEQELLREAARGMLARHDTVAAARARRSTARRRPTCGRPPPRPGWPGMLIGEEHGGAGLGAFDAMLVAQECGRVLAPVAAARAPARQRAARRRRPRRARGAWPRASARAAWLPARPPGDVARGLDGRARSAAPARAPAPTARDGRATP